MNDMEKAVEMARNAVVRQELYEDSWRKNRQGLSLQSRPCPDLLTMATALLSAREEIAGLREALEFYTIPKNYEVRNSPTDGIESIALKALALAPAKS